MTSSVCLSVCRHINALLALGRGQHCISSSHPSSDLCTGSRLMNALNINSSHSPTKNEVLTTSQRDYSYTILSLFGLHVEPAPSPHPLLPLLDYKSPTALLDMHHLTCGISSPNRNSGSATATGVE